MMKVEPSRLIPRKPTENLELMIAVLIGSLKALQTVGNVFV